MLMQGISLPALRSCASVPLPSPLDHPPMPAPIQGELHCFPETNDTTGLAVVRGSTTTTPPSPMPHPTPSNGPSCEVNKVAPAKMSRTTEWRRRKAAAAAAATTSTSTTATPIITTTTTTTSRRQYTCRLCGKSMTGIIEQWGIL